MIIAIAREMIRNRELSFKCECQVKTSLFPAKQRNLAAMIICRSKVTFTRNVGRPHRRIDAETIFALSI